MQSFQSSKIRYANLENRKVLTVNMGKNKHGFNICRKCGGAEIAGAVQTGEFRFSQPYHDRYLCRHEGTVETNLFLGYEFLTDMFMLDISYDSDQLVSNRTNEEKIILRSAATTLHEAIKKAVSLVLDIDYNEINGGWRTRFDGSGESHIEMFFYDNLTSGTGYSSLIGDILDDVLAQTKDILSSCTCGKSCRNCLDNFYNQRSHDLFDRRLGLQLLEYAVDGKYPSAYSKQEQQKMISPLKKMITEEQSLDNYVEYSIEVMPALIKRPESNGKTIYFNSYNLEDWLPNVFMEFCNFIAGK